ncbi:murein biosynthesis integral membrane protein MurJ [Bdellovibrio sp. HCB2-146]|uniref:murein biosynthesis integral membrane protein MurJ n=1 Tax=Bdellovibrio sp. HCB2-146 TaxID=3394362 RepID=UPI0039BCC324
MSREASGLKEDRKKVLKRAFSMASGTLTSRVLGLFRDVAMAALFDRIITDAWAAAFRIPNLFRRLLGEGSLSVSFIPVFVEVSAQDTTGVRARNLVNSVYTFLLLLLSVLTVLGFVTTEQILHVLLAENYHLDTVKWELTVRMARIMLGFVFFVSQYAYFMGLLNALGSFGLPAAAPALLNIAMLVFTFMPSEWFPVAGDQLAWGVLVGGVLQAAILWFALKSRNYLPQWKSDFWSADLKRVLLPILPGLLGTGLSQFMTLLNLYFASALAAGAISYIYWADRLLELPLALVSVSLGTALLPMLSEFAQGHQHERFRETLADQLLVNFFFGIPSALGLFFLARPIVEVLFMRGQFNAVDAEATAEVLRVYSLSLIVVSGGRVLAPAFYAFKQGWVPAVFAVLALVSHFVMAPFWIAQWGLAGLVFSSMLAMTFQFVLLVIALRYIRVTLPLKKTAREFSKMLLAGAALVVAVQIDSILLRQFGDVKFVRFGALAFTILFGAAVYIFISAALRVEVCESLLTHLRTKFRQR